MRFCARISSFLGFVAGVILSRFGRSSGSPAAGDLKRADFPTSTQRLGIRFTDKIREVFRHKWLQVTRRAPVDDDAHLDESRRP
jgi:hypothetical protein